MLTPLDKHPLSFLQKANSSIRIKRTITLQDIKEVLLNQRQLTRMNDRGLFVVLMAELVNHQFNLLLGRMKSLHHQICPPIKAIRKKREDGQDHAPRRHRRPKVNTSGVDIEQIASDSVSNPSHLQAQREQNQDSSKGVSQGSKGSQQGPVQPELIDFNAQIQSLGHQGQPIDIQHEVMHPDSSQNSSGSDSTRNSSNAITNLTQKLRVLGQGDVSFEGKKTIPKRRNARHAGSTVRRKDVVVDLSLSLDETRPTIDPREIPERVRREKCKLLDMQRNEQTFEKGVSNMMAQIKEKMFDNEALRRLKDFERGKRRPHDDPQYMPEPYIDMQTQNTMFQQQFGAPSTHYSMPQQQSSFNRSLQDIDSLVFRGQESATLSVLSERTKKSKDDIFMKLLWMGQRGEIVMIQQNPEEFGEITVKLIQA